MNDDSTKIEYAGRCRPHLRCCLKNAKRISEIIRYTKSEERGDLFMEVANQLRIQCLHYSATLFEAIATTYGLSK